ncbi:MAG: BACON domain-containing protein [Prevotella sp.]|nr:BACON domain-containing protein [Prevotella sp.]
MKIRYILPTFLAAFALIFTSCSDDETPTLLDQVKVSTSTVALPMAGGSNTITVNAQDSWTLEKVMTMKDSVKWLNISTVTGSAGESEIVFSASKTESGRTAQLLLTCNGEVQNITVIQGVPKAATATCAQVIAGPDSKTYRVTGVVSGIANTTYGNWYLTDNTGTIYIYGTLDKKGNEKNFSSLGIEEGDEVTVEGPKTTYGSTVELVNVTVININKSLIKVDSVQNAKLPVEGGIFTTYLTCKGQGVSVEIPADAKDWLSISSIQTTGQTSVVKFNATTNTGGDRTTAITFHTTDGKKDYTAKTSLTQAGAIVASSIADFNAAPVSTIQYRLSGVITKIADATKGRFYIKDYSGETYVYNMANFASLGLKVGDIITIVGKRGQYNTTIEVLNAVKESSYTVTPISIADVLTKADNANVYYMVTGTIKSIANVAYGNMTLQDATGEIYLYGCYPGYGATGDARKGLVDALGLKVGDTVTVIATKGSHLGSPQLSNGFYFTPTL